MSGNRLIFPSLSTSRTLCIMFDTEGRVALLLSLFTRQLLHRTAAYSETLRTRREEQHYYRCRETCAHSAPRVQRTCRRMALQRPVTPTSRFHFVFHILQGIQ